MFRKYKKNASDANNQTKKKAWVFGKKSTPVVQQDAPVTTSLVGLQQKSNSLSAIAQKFKASASQAKLKKSKKAELSTVQANALGLANAYPQLADAMNAKHSAVDANMVLEIDSKGNTEVFVKNLESGFMAAFGHQSAQVRPNDLVNLAQLDSNKFASLRTMFSPTNQSGNTMTVKEYVDGLSNLDVKQAKQMINAEPKLQRLFAKKVFSFEVAMKLDSVVSGSKDEQYKDKVISFAMNIDQTRADMRAKLTAARQRAEKINHWYYWNGRQKAQEIFAAADLIEKNYLGENASVAPFDVEKVMNEFCANGNKSLTQALNTHRHHSFFRSKTKVTTSISLYNSAEAPKFSK